CLAGVMVNPHGPALVLHTLRLSQHPNIAFMDEWKPLVLDCPAGISFLSMVGVVGALLFLSPKRFTPTQVLLLLAFGVLTLPGLRMWSGGVMIWPGVVLPHLQAWCRQFSPAGSAPPRPDLRKTILATVAVLALLSFSTPAGWLFYGDA